MFKRYLILMYQVVAMLHLKLKMTSQILAEELGSIWSVFKMVMRKEVDKTYELSKILLFNTIYTYELEKSEILTVM